MSEKIAINYIEFSCKNIPGIKTFYHNAFGWTFTDYGPDYAAFTDEKMDGGFYHSAEDVRAGNPLVVLYAARLEEIRDKIQQEGGTITEDIFPFPGGRRFHFSDPDGNILAVWSE